MVQMNPPFVQRVFADLASSSVQMVTVDLTSLSVMAQMIAEIKATKLTVVQSAVNQNLNVNRVDVVFMSPGSVMETLIVKMEAMKIPLFVVSLFF